jgi:hypothetical protein
MLTTINQNHSHNHHQVITTTSIIVCSCLCGGFIVLPCCVQACDALVQLIKDNGRWVDLPEPEEALEAETAVAA